MEKILILAGNKKQFEHFLNDVYPIEARKDFIFIGRIQDFLGIRVKYIIEVGTFWKNKDSDEIRNIVLSRVNKK